MSGSIHDRLQAPRGGRVHLSYEVFCGDPPERELPFVLGVMGDFSNCSTRPRKPLKDRRFLQIDRDNFDDVMARLAPGLTLPAENTVGPMGGEPAVQLEFTKIEDFEPAALLRKLQEVRGHDSVVVSRLLAAILHHADFQKLERAWRGLHYLVTNAETGSLLKIRVLDVSKKELQRDLDRGIEFDQSVIFKKVYADEIEMLGGEPYGVLIGDYEFTNRLDDVELLRQMSLVAATAFSPFIAAASPELFGLRSWTDLTGEAAGRGGPENLAARFEDADYVKWRAFRDSEDSRFVTLVVPRVLARPFWQSEPLAHDHVTWMNGAYAVGLGLANAFSRHGISTAIRGVPIEGLPAHDVGYAVLGEEDQPMRSTEIAVTADLERRLSQLGFLPLCQAEATGSIVFVSGQTTQKPKVYDSLDATANAGISARLPFLLAVSRFVHALRAICRDGGFSWMGRADGEQFLNRWISEYVNSSPEIEARRRFRYPLLDAQIRVEETPGRGLLRARMFIKPWLPDENLTAAQEIVFTLPRGPASG